MHTEFSPVMQVVGLFFLGLISPGPNFFVVIESTLSWGRTAGVITGLGAVAGDTIYASCGLFGMAFLILAGGRIFIAIKLAGGAYLVWLGITMLVSNRSAEISLIQSQ